MADILAATFAAPETIMEQGKEEKNEKVGGELEECLATEDNGECSEDKTRRSEAKRGEGR